MKKQLTIKTCPNCTSDQISKVCRDWAGNCRGKEYTVPNLEFHECPVCGERVFERVFDSEAIAKIREYSPAYAKRTKRLHKEEPAQTAIPA